MQYILLLQDKNIINIQVVLFLIRSHDNFCFQQGAIGPLGNPGPQGVKGFQVSCMTTPIIISFF